MSRVGDFDGKTGKACFELSKGLASLGCSAAMSTSSSQQMGAWGVTERSAAGN